MVTLKSVVCDGILANKAALLDGVPHSTLKDCLSKCVVHGCNPDPEPYLNVMEEKELAGHKEVLNIVEQYMKQKLNASLRSSTVMHG